MNYTHDWEMILGIRVTPLHGNRFNALWAQSYQEIKNHANASELLQLPHAIAAPCRCNSNSMCTMPSCHAYR